MINQLDPKSSRLAPLGATGGFLFSEADSPVPDHDVMVIDIPGGARSFVFLPRNDYAMSLVHGAFRLAAVTPDAAAGAAADLTTALRAKPQGDAPNGAGAPADAPVDSPPPAQASHIIANPN